MEYLNHLQEIPLVLVLRQHTVKSIISRILYSKILKRADFRNRKRVVVLFIKTITASSVIRTNILGKKLPVIVNKS